MSTYVLRNGRLVNKERAPPLIERFGDAPYVVSDCMPETRHMVDGNYYTSKAKFREVTRANGCEEVGTETAYMLKPRQKVKLDRGKRREDIKKAIYTLRNGKRR